MILIHIFNGIRKESVQLSECANVAEVEYGAQLAAINQLLACYSAHSVAESVSCRPPAVFSFVLLRWLL